MTKDEFKRFPESKIGRIKLRVKDLKDKSDRTLFFGRVDKGTCYVHHHTYLKDGVLHVVMYMGSFGRGSLYMNLHFWADELKASLVVPNAELSPAWTDYEAALKMHELGVEFVFDEECTEVAEKKAYYGLTFEELDLD